MIGKACPHYGPPKRNVRLLTKDGASGAPKTIVLWPIDLSLMHKQAWVGSTRNKYQISIPLFAHVFCAVRCASSLWATLVVRLARPLKLRLMWTFCSSGAPPVGAGAQQMSLVSCAYQLGPQAQLAISASGGNCSRVHRDAPPLHFF